MIDRINLSSFPCFAEGETIEGLSAVNFIFGPNGSGKTTISQCIATVESPGGEIEWKAGPITTKVYNREFTRRAFTNADGEERGVFLLGEESGDIFEKIGALEEAQSKAEDKIQSSRALIEQTEGDQKDKRHAFAQAAWARRENIPERVRREMKGLNGSIAGCANSVLEKARQYTERGEVTFEEIESRAQVAFDASITELPNLSAAPSVNWTDADVREALDAPIIGTADVPLVELIEKLGASDWVRDGVKYLDLQSQRPKRCPFCQQEEPAGLAEQLGAIFDDLYQEKLDRVVEIQRTVDEAAKSMLSFKGENYDLLEAQIDSERVSQAFVAVEQYLEELLRVCRAKIANPSDRIEYAVSSDSYSKLHSVISDANSKIEAVNEVVRNRASQKSLILDQAWQELVRGELGDLVSTFSEDEKRAAAKVRGLEGRIEQQREFLRQHQNDLRELRAKSTSSEATIQAINEILSMSQFHSFKLDKAEKTVDGYRIIRENGELADVNTLSEGERTFVTFLYFFHSLSGLKQDDESEKTCVVIDDPISSLDGDIMFVVSSLIRSLVSQVRTGKHGRVAQALILTHNSRFHSEVTFEHRGQESADVNFYRLRKFSPDPSRVESCGQKNPVRSSYQELWDEVATAQAQPDARMPWLANVLRRILESYFSTLGGANNLYTLGEDMGTSERALHEALIAWSHSGSHTIIDAEVYLQSNASNMRWLEAFERIFKSSSNGAHFGHYEMMMAEAREYQF